MNPLPQGSILLGRGGTFKVQAQFEGWAASETEPEWEWGKWEGRKGVLYYAALSVSEIAKLNRTQ